jgi:hypothetical protein
MDFMNVSNSFPVRYRLAKLDHDAGHYRAGEAWAEPSVEHAAEMMRYVFEHRAEGIERGRTAQEEISDRYSCTAVGKVVADRLAVIAMRTQFGLLQQDLKAPIPDLQCFLDKFSALDAYVPVHNLRYQNIKRSLQAAVQTHVPPAATVAVVSRGDDELLDLGTRHAVHFPQGADGEYAGYYPRDSAEAIQNLEVLRTRGGEFLVFPDTSLWWLDHYPEFRDHLEQRYSLRYRDDYCTVFGLSAH